MADENEGQPPDYAGYESSEALANGYRASSQEAKRLKDQNVALEQQLRAMSANQAPRQDPNDPRQVLEGYAVPVDALDRYLDAKLQTSLGQAFQPVARLFEARPKMLARYPDYGKFEADVSQYAANDPEVSQGFNAMMQTDPFAAQEYAYLKYSESQRRKSPAPEESNGARQVRRQASEARIPSQRSGDARSTPDNAADLVDRAREHFQKTGNAVPFAKTRLRQVIPDSFLNQ